MKVWEEMAGHVFSPELIRTKKHFFVRSRYSYSSSSCLGITNVSSVISRPHVGHLADSVMK